MRTNKKRQEKTKSFASKGAFPYQWAFTLLLPVRNIFLSPKRLIKRIELKVNSTVLELGTDPCYLNFPILKN
jgi:hypothetical protein